MRGALQFAARIQRNISGPESPSYVTTDIYGTFELMLCARGRSPTSSFLLCSLFSVALDLPRGAHLDFPRPRAWEAAAVRYRALFAAYATEPHDILLRLPNQRLYIGPHVQEYLAGLDAQCEGRLIRWTLGVQSALEASDTLPLFSMAKAATPERTNRTLESDPLHTGPGEQGGAARSAAERRRTAGNRACISLRLLRAGTREIYWGFGGRLFTGTYLVSPRRARASELHAGP